MDQINREFDFVSLVCTFQEGQQLDFQLDQQDIEAIEEELDGNLQIGEGPFGRGLLGARLSIPTRQIDLTIQPSRLEVRSLQPAFSQSIGERMVRLMSHAARKLGDAQWRSVGHNFVLSLSVSEGTAVEHLRKKMLVSNLDEDIGHRIVGANMGLWIEVGESRLLLRLDPPRGSTTTKRISANANFSVELGQEGKFPEQETTVSRLLRYSHELDEILRGLEL